MTAAPADAPRNPFTAYAVPVVDDLAELAGPTSGVGRLPISLDSSARAEYDFTDPAARRAVARIVLIEAGSVDEITTWVDSDTLFAAWPDLVLPRRVREPWERRHPELARLELTHPVPRR